MDFMKRYNRSRELLFSPCVEKMLILIPIIERHHHREPRGTLVAAPDIPDNEVHDFPSGGFFS